MHKTCSIILLISLGIRCVSPGETSGSKRPLPPSTSREPSDVLPLIFIKHDNFCLPPNLINKVTWSVPGEIFSGGTRFSNIGEHQIYMCAIESLLNEAKREKKSASMTGPHDGHCSFEIQFNETDPLQCINEPQPFFEKIYQLMNDSQNQEKVCGPNFRGKMYQFVYKICITDKPIPNEAILKLNINVLENNVIRYRDLYDVYQLCYDEKEDEIIYTRNKINSYELLFNENLKHEREQKYNYITEGYQYFSDHFAKIKEAYKNLNIEMEETPSNGGAPSTEEKPPYIGQQLVPADDMEFALMRKTTFHYINTKPMREPYVKVWNQVTQHIRDNVLEQGRNYVIYTGVLTFPDRKGKSTQKLFQIPDIWIKAVRFSYSTPHNDNRLFHNAITIMMNTNPSNDLANAFIQRNCPINLCEDIYTEQFGEIGDSVKCCEVTDEIKQFFNMDFAISDTLQIGFSVDEDDKDDEAMDDLISQIF